MKIGFALSFEKNSMNGTFLSFLYKKYVKFNPYSFTIGHKGAAWNEKKHLNEIQLAGGEKDISIIDLNRNIFSITTTGSQHPHQSFLIEQDSGIFHPTNDEVYEIINWSKTFIAGYLYNEEYTFVQSSESETLFEHRDISKEILMTLKNTPYKLGVFDKKKYNTRFNPGRSVLISHTWLMVAWKMWFGEQFFKLVPRERILSFPYATEIKELPSGQVYVQLYDKIEEPHTPDNIFRQWKWREWLDYDGLEEKYG